MSNEYELNEKSDVDSIVRSLISEVRELRAQLKETRAYIDETSRRKVAEGDNLTTFVATNVNCIGLKEAVMRKHPLVKIVWVILVILGATATAYYVYKGTYEYLNKETATKIFIQRQATYEFPDLILCPPWWFDYEKAIAAGLSPNGLTYSLFYANLDEGFLEADELKLLFPNGTDIWKNAQNSDNPPSAETYNQMLIAARYQMDYVKGSRADFHDFFARKKFRSLEDYYFWLALDIGNVTKDDVDTGAWHWDDGWNGTLHLDECRGCQARPPEKTLFSNSICYRFHLENATPRSADHPVTLRLRNADSSNGLLSSSAWYVDFVSNVGPRGPSTIVKPYFTYTIKLSAQRQISTANESVCIDTEKNTTYDQRLCTELCLSRLRFKKSHELARGAYPSFAVTNIPNETLNAFDMMIRLFDPMIERYIDGAEGKIDAPTSTNANPSTVDTFDKNAATLPTDQELIDCYRSCLPPCDRVIYDMSMHGHEMEGVERRKNESIIEISIKHSAVFQGGIITWQEVPTATFSDFVSNVGGTLGLFLGCTLLTSAQLILSCVSYALDVRRARRSSTKSVMSRR